MSTSNDVPPALLIVCTDLIFSTKITGTAKALSRPFAVARTLERLKALLESTIPNSLLIVDLNAAGIDAVEAVRMAKAHPSAPRVIAFLSHVQLELAAQAREAGADSVMPRSAFSAQLPMLLATS